MLELLGRTGVAFVLRALGITFAAVGAGLLVCTGLSVVFADGATLALGLPAAAAVLLAAGTLAAARPYALREEPPLRGVFAGVAAAWVAAALLGTAPYLIDGTISEPIRAFFESMSGFTTTGASVLEPRILSVPDSLVIWRQLTQWIGGIGIVVFVVAAAPAGTVAFQRVLSAEASSPVTERRTPRIADTAKLLLTAYGLLTLLGLGAYLLAGMGVFDAVAHTLTSVATGGFSSNPQSIGGFDSVAIELVAIGLMLLGATNFAVYTALLVRSGPVRPQLAEVGWMVGIVAVVSAGVAISLLAADDVDGLANALLAAGFQITSFTTTTGYTTAPFDTWNESAELLILWVMLLGGCAGSTASGLKVLRAVLIGKTVWQGVRRQFQPRRVAALRLGGRVYPESIREAILFFAIVYAGVFVAGSVIMAAFGVAFDSALGMSAATVANIGPAVGTVPYTGIPDGGLLVLCGLMLAGRLEILTVLVLLVPAFWRRRPG